MDVNSAVSMGYSGQGGSVSSVSSAPAATTPVESSSSVSSVSTAPKTVANKGTDNAPGNDQVSSKAIKEAVEQINKNANGSEAVFGFMRKPTASPLRSWTKRQKKSSKNFRQSVPWISLPRRGSWLVLWLTRKVKGGHCYGNQIIRFTVRPGYRLNHFRSGILVFHKSK